MGGLDLTADHIGWLEALQLTVLLKRLLVLETKLLLIPRRSIDDPLRIGVADGGKTSMNKRIDLTVLPTAQNLTVGERYLDPAIGRTAPRAFGISKKSTDLL